MSDIFLSNASIHAGLVRHHSRKTKDVQIAKAQQSLDTLKIEIDRRQQKLDDVLAFLSQKKDEHHRLSEQYKNNPEHACLAKDISRLERGITKLTEKIECVEPEKKQVHLKAQYDELKSVFLFKIGAE